MRLKFRGWEQDLPHHGERGGVRERRVADLLRSVLPKRYGVSSGHVIDPQGGVSLQADIIIYDAVDGIKLPVDEYYSLFPCESVYAIVEVKSTLSASSRTNPSGTIYECVEGATRTKFLHRHIDGEFNMMQYFVFAYQSRWHQNCEPVRKWFHRFVEDANHVLPDAVYVLEPDVLICTYETIDLLRYSHVYKRSALLAFISEIADRLSKVKVSTPNLWNTYLEPRVGEPIVTIYQEDGKSYDVHPIIFRAAKLP